MENTPPPGRIRVKHAKKFLPSGDLQKMYRGIVEPHFSYCCSVWGRCSETKLNSLQKIQNRAARITTDSPYDASAAPLLQNLAWPSIKDLIRKETATLTYKALNSLAPQYLGELFSRCSEGSDRILRSTETNLHIPLVRDLCKLAYTSGKLAYTSGLIKNVKTTNLSYI